MKLFKKTITWDEPKPVRKAFFSYPVVPVWTHFVFGIFVVLSIVIAFLGPSEEGADVKLWIILGGILIGAVLGYVLPLVDNIGGSSIRVDSAGILRMDSMLTYQAPILMLMRYRQHHWKWKEIAYLYLHREQIEDKTYQVVEVVGHDDNNLGVVGLPLKKFKMDKFLAVLEENNCTMRGLEQE